MSCGGFLVENSFYEFVSKVQLLWDYNRLSSNKSFPQNSKEERRMSDGWLFSVLDITGINLCCPTCNMFYYSVFNCCQQRLYNLKFDFFIKMKLFSRELFLLVFLVLLIIPS